MIVSSGMESNVAASSECVSIAAPSFHVGPTEKSSVFFCQIFIFHFSENDTNIIRFSTIVKNWRAQTHQSGSAIHFCRSSFDRNALHASLVFYCCCVVIWFLSFRFAVNSKIPFDLSSLSSSFAIIRRLFVMIVKTLKIGRTQLNEKKTKNEGVATTWRLCFVVDRLREKRNTLSGGVKTIKNCLLICHNVSSLTARICFYFLSVVTTIAVPLRAKEQHISWQDYGNK